MKKRNIVLAVLAASVFGFGAGNIADSKAAYLTDSPDVSVLRAVVPNIKKECEEALSLIDLNVDADSVVADLILPVKSVYNVDFSWESSDESVIALKAEKNGNGNITGYRGVVTRGETDKTVTLTAKAVIGSNEDSSATRSFPLIVKKAQKIAEEELPVAMEEDFSSYAAGIDISNYYRWTQSGSEAQVASVVEKDEELDNINARPTDKVLKVQSKNSASDVRLTRKINAKSDSEKNVAFEGYFLIDGNTNGIRIDFLAGSRTVAGVGFSSKGFSQYTPIGYQTTADEAPMQGVWTKFRVDIRLSASYALFSAWDYRTNSYKSLAKDLDGFLSTKTSDYGISSGGGKADLTAFRIVAASGAEVGTTYLADLKFDTATNLPKETEMRNPNRTDGIGTIGGYESSILAYEEDKEKLEGVDPKKFTVHNRFDEEKTYTAGTDYTVKTTVGTENGDGSIVYTHEYVLTSTGEKKTVTQTVYFDQKDNVASVTDFSVSYLKADASDAAKGYLTVSGKVVRKDATMHYVVLDKGSSAPSVADVANQNTALSGYASSGSAEVKSREFSVDSELLDISKEYDVYAVLTNANGNSALYSSTDISTVINIRTPEEFHDMSVNVSTYKSTFRLMNDLDFSSYYWEYGSADFEFHGVLDGQGHMVSNLTVSSTLNCVGLFGKCYGTVKNLTFKNVSVYGLGNVGIIAGNLYGGTYEHLKFIDCTVAQEPTTEGGEGYFGALAGRFRGGNKTSEITDMTISGLKVICPKYCGLLTGGLEDGESGESYTNIRGIYAEGSVDTDGAAVGLVGRNRSNLTIDNAVILLHIRMAKKEIGIVAGHNKEGGKLVANNVFGDLKIDAITQPNYFGQLIGSHDTSTSSYSVTNFTYADEDYSSLSESLAPDTRTVTIGTAVNMPETLEDWEQNTFIRDFDTSLYWAYGASESVPVLSLRKESELNLSAEMFSSYVGRIDPDDVRSNHYAIYKAMEIYEHLSDEEKAKISASDLEKYEQAVKAYESMQQGIGDLLNGIGFRG